MLASESGNWTDSVAPSLHFIASIVQLCIYTIHYCAVLHTMFSYLCHFHISTFGTCDSPHLKGLEIGNRPGGWDKHIDFPVDQPMGECSKKNFSITSAFVSLVCSCHGFCGFRCHQPHMAYASTQEPNPATIVAQCPGRQSRVDKGERLKVTYFGP